MTAPRPGEETTRPPSTQHRPIRVLDSAVYRGPNIYALQPMVRLTLDLGPEERWSASELASVATRLTALFPAWVPARTGEALLPEQLILRLILAVQQAGGGATGQGLAIPVRGQPGAFHLLYSYDQERPARLAGVTALRLLDSALPPEWQGIRGLGQLAPTDSQPFDLAPALERLRHLTQQTALDPVTRALVNAAERLDIPVARLGDCDSPLVQLGQGRYGRQLGSGMTDQTSQLALITAEHPERLRRLLERVGVPVPEFEVVASAPEAVAAAAALGGGVVTRPLRRSGGRGLRLNLRTPEQVREGFEQATPFSGRVMVEQQLPGRTYRLLVVGGEVVTVTERTPGPRGDDPAVATMPEVHPETVSVARTAALALGLDVAAVDVVTPDLAQSVRLGGGVVAVKGLPDIDLRPPSDAVFGAGRDVASDVLRLLYPAGAPSRVPVLAVTGTNGKSTTARMVAHILSCAGHTAGLTTTSGVYVGRERISVGDATGPRSARMVLHHPDVTAAVLETARGGLLREGLGFAFCDAGAVLNVQEDHLGLRGIDTLEDLAWVKSLIVRVVRPGGLSVLNADDPLTLKMAASAPGPVALFSVHGDPVSEAVQQHRAAGGMTLLREAGASGDMVVIYRGGVREELMHTADVPATLGGRALFNVSNALAACALCLAVGTDLAVIRTALASFTTSFEQNPGRMNVFDGLPFRVIVDYAHNPAGLAAQRGALHQLRLPGARLIGMVSVPGDRRDQDIRDVGAAAAQTYDLLYLREAAEGRGRPRGEVMRLMHEGAVQAGFAPEQIHRVLDEHEAVDAALRAARPGDLVVLMPTDVEGIWQQVQAFVP